MKKSIVAALSIAAIGMQVTPSVHAQEQGPIIFLAGPASDPFWGAVKYGVDAAKETFGVEAQYTAPQDFNDIVRYTRGSSRPLSPASRAPSSSAISSPNQLSR